MNPANAPPPMPARAPRIRRTAKGVLGFWTARAQPTTGRMNSAVVSVTSLRVPMIGGRNVQTRRSVPPASPGIAMSQ